MESDYTYWLNKMHDELFRLNDFYNFMVLNKDENIDWDTYWAYSKYTDITPQEALDNSRVRKR